jgi:protein AFG1
MITRQFTRLLRPKRTIPRSSPRFLPLLPFHSESTSLVSSSPSTATRQIHYSPILRPPSSSPITQAAQPSTTPHPPVKENIQAGLGIDQVPLETIPGPITPLTRYDQLVQAGALRDDEHQRTIITKLETLHDELREYNPPPVPSSAINNNPSSSWFSKLFSPSSSKNSYDLDLTPPKGLYLHGDVGCGKTMLMDLFYSTLPPHLHDSRRRIHFHAFMVDVFRRVHAIKNGLSTEISSPLKESITEVDEGTREQIKDLIPHVRNIERQRVRSKRAYNPMEGRSDERPIGVEALHGGGLFSSLFPSSGPQGMSEEAAIQEAARELAEEGRVLCFDEFQVTDIVTAMILRGLFERLMQLGVVCVITSK